MTWTQQIQTAGAGPVLATACGAYALGCFATGYLLVRARTGRDIRDVASGSIGARNVSRVLGRPGFVLTVAGDFGKGALAVWAAQHFATHPLLPLIALLAVVIGHIWPAPLLFRGGKGVATALGGLIVLDWRLAVAYAASFAVGLAFMRKTTLPGLVAFLILPLASYWLSRDPVTAGTLCALAGLIWFAHRQNVSQEIASPDGRHSSTVKSESRKS